MPGGWAKNWAGVRGTAVSCAFGMREESLESLTRALLVTAARLAFWPLELNSEGLQEAEGKVVSSSFSSSLPLPSPCSPLLLPVLSLLSNPKTSRGATQHLLFSSSAYKLPFPS